ncbi:hypothetical protein TL16_g10688 [Triparma laevis f. inornata]|uniref:J domain-containing protein n=2 Tax=Triparma laevis TaxID=1534972 RepID=A0A9W7KYU5_9STRA|nr:hypothetical protein TL16_g10688 [Triparma laevis f. inornata]GMI16908.1 hypothetical protein TrLO_g12215 [Triparma laevis f. longispina]
MLSSLLRPPLARILKLPQNLYHTNGSILKKSDPYALLNLEYGATIDEIKSSYRKLAMLYHPDVGSEKSVDKFSAIQKAHDALLKSPAHVIDGSDSTYTLQTFRQADRISQKRTDVAGSARKRPARPVGIDSSMLLDFAGGSVPVGKGRKGEILGDGEGQMKKKSSTVGTGQSKWRNVKTVEYKSWKK